MAHSEFAVNLVRPAMKGWGLQKAKKVSKFLLRFVPLLFEIKALQLVWTREMEFIEHKLLIEIYWSLVFFNVNQVHSAGIRTHNLRNISLLT